MDIVEYNEDIVRISVKAYRLDFDIHESEVLPVIREIRDAEEQDKSTYGGYCLECGAMKMWKLRSTRANLTFCDECAPEVAVMLDEFVEEHADALIAAEL